MAEIIFAIQSCDGFELHPDFLVYCYQPDVRFELIAGKQYTVSWDGAEWSCVAQDAGDLLGAGCTVLGNAADFYLSGNGEPFLIGTFPDEYPLIAALLDTEAGGVHTVGIFETPVSNPDDIALYNRDGENTYFSGIETIRVNTRDGGTKDFIARTPVEGAIVLDFSAGDMEVLPNEGEVFSKVTVLKPENLVPENIAKDVEIAGVIGTMESGGSDFDFTDENLRFFAYNIDQTTKTITIYRVLYDIIYSITGSYDVIIPDQIGGYYVVLAAV